MLNVERMHEETNREERKKRKRKEQRIIYTSIERINTEREREEMTRA